MTHVINGTRGAAKYGEGDAVVSAIREGAADALPPGRHVLVVLRSRYMAGRWVYSCRLSSDKSAPAMDWPEEWLRKFDPEPAPAERGGVGGQKPG
jgi:hypothetical protein